MIRPIANQAMADLGLAGDICRPKKRLRVIKALVLLFLFFVLKIRLLGLHLVEIHRNIVLLEVLAGRSPAHLLRLKQVLS